MRRNVGGPSNQKKKVLKTGFSVWREMMTKTKNRELVIGVQRGMPLRSVNEYSAVGTDTAIVLAVVSPIDLLVEE